MIGSLRALVSEALGDRVTSVVSAPWGHTNRSWIVQTASHRRLVVQVYTDARAMERRMSAVDQLVGIVDLPLPVVRAHGEVDGLPWAVTDLLPGEPGYVAAGADLSAHGWSAMAASMGRCLRALQLAPTRTIDLPSVWDDPEALAMAAHDWLRHLGPHLHPSTVATVSRQIDELPESCPGRVVCHGDFGPQNVLFEGDRVSGVLDLEDVRLADPLLDVAWWNWLVRAHTPRAFERGWCRFVVGAGLAGELDHPRSGARVRRLITLRLLEAAERERRTRPEKHAGWARRLEQEVSVPTTQVLPPMPRDPESGSFARFDSAGAGKEEGDGTEGR